MSDRSRVVEIIIGLLKLGAPYVEVKTDNPEKDQRAYNKMLYRRQEDVRASKDAKSVIFKKRK